MTTIDETKDHIVSVGFYTVYNIKVSGNRTSLDAVTSVKDIYNEQGLQAILNLGDEVGLHAGEDEDVLIQYEGRNV